MNLAVNELRVDRVDTESAWDAMRPQWNELFQGSPAATPALHFDWMRLWWRHYRDAFPGSRLCILRAWRGEQLVGLLPLYRRKSRAGLGARRLAFLSTGEQEREETCPDYLDQLCLPGEDVACAGAFWAALRQLRWDILTLLDMPAGSALAQAGSQLPHARLGTRGVCPQADLDGGFEAYLGRLSANGRQKARSLLRKAQKDGASLSVTGPGDNPDAHFRTLESLHQGRWTRVGRPGVFGAPRFAGFHRDLIRGWVPQRRALIAVLRVADEPVAAIYGFLQGGSFAFYQSGVAIGTGGPLQKPGLAAHLMLMRQLSEQGVHTYDFLRGSAEYKMRLATRKVPLVELRIHRVTVRSLTSRGASLAVRAVRRVRRGRAA